MNVVLHPPATGDLRTRILDAAEMLGDALGQEGITMRHLAASAGVHTSALYQNFDGKASLLAALEARVRERHDAALEEGFAGSEDAWIRLHRICVAHVDFARRAGWRYAAAFSAYDLDIGSSACGGAESFLGLSKACLSDLEVSTQSQTEVALRLWIAVHGLATTLAKSECKSGEERASAAEHAFVDNYVLMLLHGIGAMARPDR